ncbi:MAG: hypothetical protein K2O18_14365 [Oscillospiraceae bacterium]|nr:hypothetical protein [Oscillospiraceae bacterium]
MFGVHVSDDSFAVWLEYTPLTATNLIALKSKLFPSKIDIHINEWIMKNSQTTAFIDFGIRIYNPKSVNTIGFFVPYSIEEHEVEDLTSHLQNEETARGIFNANCTINIHRETGILDLEYGIHKSNATTLPRRVAPSHSGTKIYFDLTSIKKRITRDEFYFRFRIPHNTLATLLRKHKKTTNLLLSFFASPIIKEDYIYIIRVNEMRTLPDDIRFNPTLQKQKINLVRVLLAFNGDLQIDSSSCYRLRKVENLLEHYVPKNFNCEDSVVYHWLSENNPKNYYNFTFSFRKETINKLSLGVYASFVIVLSMLASLLFSRLDFTSALIGLPTALANLLTALASLLTIYPKFSIVVLLVALVLRILVLNKSKK